MNDITPIPSELWEPLKAIEPSDSLFCLISHSPGLRQYLTIKNFEEFTTDQWEILLPKMPALAPNVPTAIWKQISNWKKLLKDAPELAQYKPSKSKKA